MARTTPVNTGYKIINGSATGSNKAYVDVWLEWNVLGQDTQNNTSRVRVLLYAASTKSSSTSWGAAEKFGYVGYDGGNKQYRSTTYDFSNYAVNCFGDYTYTVAHGADGSKSVTLEGAWSTTHSSYISGGSASGKIALPTIPRASSITAAGNVALGQPCSVQWTPNSAAFRYKLKFSIGSWSYTTGVIHPNKVSTYTYAEYVLPIDVARQITGDDNSTMKVVLTTYSDSNGSTTIGSDDATFTVTVPQNSDTKPTVTMTLVAVDDFNGLYLQGRTKLQGTLKATGMYGADIKSLTMTVGGTTYENPWLSKALTKPGKTQVVATAVDSRGFTGTAELTVEVLPYYRPRLTATAYRCKEDGTAADDGEFLKIRTTVDYASVDGQNSASLWYRYRMEGAEKYTGDVVLVESLTSGEAVETGSLLDGTFYKENAYSVQIIALDRVGEQQVATISIPSERIYKHKRAGGKGLGLGGYCERDDLLDIHWDIRARKNLRVDGQLMANNVGGVYLGVTNLSTPSGKQTIRLQSSFNIISDAATDRQSLLMFGSDNGIPICGTLSLSAKGYGNWGGTESVTVTSEGDGVFTIRLPAVCWDYFVFLSAEPFSILEE